MKHPYLGMVFIIIVIISLYEITKTIKDNKKIIKNTTTHRIKIYKLKWPKDEITVKINDKVEWKNMMSMRLQIATDNPDINNSGLLHKYETHSHIFLSKGRFIFYSPLYKKLGKFIVNVK